MSGVLFGRILQTAAEKLKPRLDEPGEFRLIEKIRQPDHVNWDPETQKGEPFHSYVWGTVIAEVEVDTITWQTRAQPLTAGL